MITPSGESLPELPHPELPNFDRTQHEYVSAACAHRRHSACDDGCRFCGAECLCVCHRWRLPVESN